MIRLPRLCSRRATPYAARDWSCDSPATTHRVAHDGAGGFVSAHADAIDYDLCLRLSETTGIVHVPQVLYRRRIHPLAAEIARWAEGIEARYAAFVDAVRRRGLDAQYDHALHIDSWHILQPLRPFGGAGNWG